MNIIGYDWNYEFWILDISMMSTSFGTILPSRKVMYSDRVLRACLIIMDDRELFTDLIVLNMDEYEIILGMDQLSKYHFKIDCRKKIVVFHPLDTDQFVFQGIHTSSRFPLILATKAQRLLEKGCTGYLASVVDVSVEQKLKPEDVPVVQDFLDVFPEDLPGLPPEREIDFVIDLAPGTTPISKTPYRMAPAELKELKTQLQELLDKRFIHPSFSP